MTREFAASIAPSVAAEVAVPDAVVALLEGIGVREAYGVSGGGVAAIWGALSASGIAVHHFRHEAGAAFAATEASLLADRPVAVFVTTGPGVSNALTGVMAARSEGARVVLISACSAPAQRGRWAIQETTDLTMPAGLYAAGPVFDLAEVLGEAGAFEGLGARLGEAMRRPCVAHLAIPTSMFAARVTRPGVPERRAWAPAAGAEEVAACARALNAAPFAIWVGYGARGAAAEIRAVAEKTGAAVLCTPRGKGVFPEDHPQFVGVTGMGGHETVYAALADLAPERILVLGTRLGEPSSFWHPGLVPAGGFVHVDIDPAVPGRAYPDVPTLAVTADAARFLADLLPKLSPGQARRLPLPARPSVAAGQAPVRPEALMAAIQARVVEACDAPVLAESGNSFTWATHFLRFPVPGRYRVSTQLGAMGHCAAGVVGAALALGGKAVAIVGDGALLMNNEVNTAAKYGAAAVWIVLNDARYNMCEQGMQVLGMRADARFPEVDFAAVARAMGAGAEVVTEEAALDAALARAMAARGPYVLDVRIDPACAAPSLGRNRGLRALTAGANAGRPISFPGEA